MEILIVDGDPAVLDTLAEIARALGHATMTASHPNVALQMARGRVFDACLIDMDMLHTGAGRLVEILRWRNPSIRAVGSSAVGGLWGAHVQLFDEHLSKPASIAWICAAIEGVNVAVGQG